MSEENKNKIKRRDFLAGFATVPVLGVFGYGLFSQLNYQQKKKELFSSEHNLNEFISENKSYLDDVQGDIIKVGIIGTGRRGINLLKSLGYSEENKGVSDYGDLKIELVGVCDVYNKAAENALAMTTNNKFIKSGRQIKPAVRYKHYQDMLNDKNINAVIIATPDHWHAEMILDAISAGKHIYAERCLTRTLNEIYKIRDAIKNSSIIFQYGNQNRQLQSNKVARQMMIQNILGKVASVKTHTYRNTSAGITIEELSKTINPNDIDWKEWLGNSAAVPYSPERFLGWWNYFDYSGGLHANLFSNEFDAVNQVLSLGIPKSVNAMGGIFYDKIDRDTPDVFQASFDYPESELLLTYDADLANSDIIESKPKIKVKEIIGSEAWLKLDSNIVMYPDPNSTYYKDKIKENAEVIATNDVGSVEAVSSASKKMLASLGMVSTFKSKTDVDVTYLHLREWLSGIRTGIVVSGTFKTAYQDTVTALMSTKSYLEKRRVQYNNREDIVS